MITLSPVADVDELIYCRWLGCWLQQWEITRGEGVQGAKRAE